jgi:cyclic beta-1,2-glucan synthetase
MYRLLVEALPGVNREGDELHLTPHMPESWTTFKIHYRHLHTVYHITITRLASGVSNTNPLVVDGLEIPWDRLPLRDDRREHAVELFVA